MNPTSFVESGRGCPACVILRRNGFTMIELPVAISVLGFQKWMVAASSKKCLSNLRPIGVALRTFVGKSDGLFPQTGLGFDYGQIYTQSGKSSWMEQLDAYTGLNHRISSLCQTPKSPNNYFLSTWAAYCDNGMNYPPPLNSLRLQHPASTILARD